MLISHRHRFIFVKTRKAAGTSLEIALSRFLGPEDVITPLAEHGQPGFEALRAQNYLVPKNAWRFRDRLRSTITNPPKFSQHSTIGFAKLFLSDEVWRSYFKFTTERNSWDLAVSAFWWYQFRHEPGISWQEFVRSKALVGYSNWHMYTIGDRIAVDEVLRYDRLEENVSAIAVRLGLPALELPRAKGGFRPARSYRELYDDESRQRIAEVFHREIAQFGWRFEGT